MALGSELQFIALVAGIIVLAAIILNLGISTVAGI